MESDLLDRETHEWNDLLREEILQTVSSRAALLAGRSELPRVGGCFLR